MLLTERRAKLSQYAMASEAFRSGHLEAADWFPEDTYPPALPLNGARAPRRPPSSPTRRIKVLESGVVERGEIPVVEMPARVDTNVAGGRVNG